MKNILYGVLVGLISIIAYPCPFIFINDTRKTVVLLDQNSQAKTMILPGQTKQIPGAIDVPNNYIWVYVQEKIGSTLFSVKYGITEYECIEEGKPLPQLKLSQFALRSLSKNIEKGFGIIRFDANEFPQVLLTIKNESANTLVERSVVASADLILKRKKTREQLKKELPAELYERVIEYVNAKDI